jgi:hypothetical protein
VIEMDRWTERLASRTAVKVIVGLTCFDRAEVAFLTRLYALAGADVVDVAAEPGVVTAARRAATEAAAASPGTAPPAIMASLALASDPHVEGVAMDAAQRAAVVPSTAAELRAGVAACLEAGADMLELHAAASDDASLREAAEAMSSLLGERYLSVCLGTQGRTSPQDAVRQAQLAQAVHGPRTMIQAEGLTLGGRADPTSSLQGLALAQVLLAHTSAYVLVAGAANHWTRHLAQLLAVPVHGVACGTYARALVGGLAAGGPQGPGWEDGVRVARAFVDQLRGGACAHG